METLLIHRELLRTPIFDQIIDMLRTEHVRNTSKHLLHRIGVYILFIFFLLFLFQVIKLLFMYFCCFILLFINCIVFAFFLR